MLLVGCFADTAPLGPGDSRRDAATDTTPDAGDVGVDTASDVAPDVIVDSGTDATDASDASDASDATDVEPPDTCVSRPEECNEVDDDCDGRTDEDVTVTHYADVDGDGDGAPGTAASDCVVPARRVTNMNDCDDTNGAINRRATEICDGVDNNCDGMTDEGLVVSRFVDADDDGYGIDPVNVCVGDEEGTAEEGGDCDDTNDEINPSAEERCNGFDDDCDGDIDIDEGEALCPDGCDPHLYEEHLYLLCSEPLSFRDAREFCRDETNGLARDLAAIRDADENAFLAGIVTGAPAAGDPWESAAWIGLTDRGRDGEGNYRWTTGEPVDYLNWAFGEPNDAVFPGEEDCIFMINRAAGDWNDNVCDVGRRFICESL